MVIGRIGCSLGRHSVDREDILKVSGRNTGRCKHCRKVLEEFLPGHWVVPPLRDAGLGQRSR